MPLIARQDLASATKLAIDDVSDNSASPSFTATLDGTIRLTLTVTPTFTPTSTSATQETTELGEQPQKSSSGSKDIPVGALVITFVVIAVLCCALIAFWWWKRRRDKEARRRERERRMNKHRLDRPGHSTDKEVPWEEFKEPPPAALRSPGSFYSEDVHHAAQPYQPRRMSVKSTVTGKVNPSNNFASYDDEDDDEDNRSTRSRPLFSPSRVHFHDANAPPVPIRGDPSSFLPFPSGLDRKPTFPPQPLPIQREGPLREGPTTMVTPTPKRANTQKSHKGLNDVDKKAKQSNMIALSNIIAALDSQDPRRNSIESTYSGDHSGPAATNPFQDPSFVQNLRDALPPPSPAR